MRIAYLDCFSGISGDMFLGAAVDAGVSLEKLKTVARALGLHAELASHRVERAGISATKVDVLIHGRPDQPLDLTPGHKAESHDPSTPDSTHSHSHSHSHPHSHQPEPAPAQHAHSHVHRGLAEIGQIIARAPISDAAQAFALKTFSLLAQAEGKIHNRPPESIHFHEVGSEDAIVDVICAAVAVEALAIDGWYCSALNTGSGTVQCAHGTLPVPAPATAELLRGAPVFSSGLAKELLTPTGAAILRALEVRFEPLPPMTLAATGYGAGARDFPGSANVVRLTIGQAPAVGAAVSAAYPAAKPSPACASPASAPFYNAWPTSAPRLSAQMWGEQTRGEAGADTITVLEANLDDMNPQLFSYVQQKLLDAGALDAFGVPVQMKKGRPGIVFTVLALPAHAELLARILLTETTTLGVRMRQEHRRILDREHVTVASPWGPIRIKLGRLQGEVVNCAPEFEDCRKIAEATGVPLKTVLQEALRLAPAAGSKVSPPATTNPGSADALKSFSS